MNDKELITSDQKLLQVNPDVSRDEQLDFINTYRNLQAADTDEINRQTHAQGSDLPSFKGGLTGVGGYLATRYQQPQTEARVATLRSAAQQAALNRALKNIQENMQEQYNKAYRDYSNAAAKKRADDGKKDTGEGTVEEEDNAGGYDPTSKLAVPKNDQYTVETVFRDGKKYVRYLDANGNVVSEYADGEKVGSEDRGWNGSVGVSLTDLIPLKGIVSGGISGGN